MPDLQIAHPSALPTARAVQILLDIRMTEPEQNGPALAFTDAMLQMDYDAVTLPRPLASGNAAFLAGRLLDGARRIITALARVNQPETCAEAQSARSRATAA